MGEVAGVGLAQRFPGTRWLFTDLDFELTPGEVVGVVGPSGSGKSTLLSILAGWLAPSKGTLTRRGIDHVGWVFQNPHGVPRRTALDHVVLPLLARGRQRRAADGEAQEILARFNLADVAGREFRALSGGEAQRLMLARAVATASDLLLVDEPTAQLDLATAATVTGVLANIAQQDAIVVVATHDPRARAACQRVIDLDDYQSAGSGEDADPEGDHRHQPEPEPPVDAAPVRPPAHRHPRHDRPPRQAVPPNPPPPAGPVVLPWEDASGWELQMQRAGVM